MNMNMDMELLKFVLSVINLVAVVWLALSGRRLDFQDNKVGAFHGN